MAALMLLIGTGKISQSKLVDKKSEIMLFSVYAASMSLITLFNNFTLFIGQTCIEHLASDLLSSLHDIWSIGVRLHTF